MTIMTDPATGKAAKGFSPREPVAEAAPAPPTDEQ